MSGIDTRHISRDSLFLLASLQFDGDTGEYKVKVRNISAGGLMAEGSAPAERGAKLSVQLRNIGWVDGVVAWVHGERFGIAFASEIDSKVVRSTSANPSFETPRFIRTNALHAHMSQQDPGRLRKV